MSAARALLLALAGAFPGAGTGDGTDDGHVLARAGETGYRIVVAGGAGEAGEAAAGELAEYLGRITGAEFAVAPAPAHGPALRLTLDADAGLGAEGFRLRSTGADLEIAGGDPRGLRYGVYHFLEVYGGVRWYAPEFTVVPARSALVVPRLDERHRPALGYREVLTREADDPRYSARNRLNGRFGHRLEDTGRRPERFVALRRLHIFDLVPRERYRETHPEYFGAGQLRFASPAVRRVALQALRERLARWPRGPWYLLIEHADRDTYHAGGADGELIRRHGAPAAAYLDFVRALAAAVTETHPQVTVLAQAYRWSRTPVADMALPDNLGVLFSGIERDFGRPLTAPANRAVLEDLEGWARISDHVIVWDYHTNFAGYLQPYPNLRAIGPDLETLDGIPGVRGLFAQGAYHTRGGELSALRTWLLARLMWDPGHDAGALIGEFLEGYYGAAAPALQAYLDLLHDAARAAGTRLGHKVPPTAAYLDAELLQRADTLFAQAERAVADDPERRRHVRVARMAVDYAILAALPARGGPEWVRHGERLERLRGAVEAAGMTAYREGGANSPAAMLQALSIARSQAPVPAPCRGLPAARCRVLQDLSFDLAGADLVAEPAASDGAAATMPGESRAWGIQVPLDRLLPDTGRWRIHLEARAAAAAPGAGTALHAGVYPGRQRTAGLGELAGEDYVTLALPGTWTADAGRYVFVAPPGSDAVPAIYVDRVIAVREDG